MLSQQCSQLRYQASRHVLARIRRDRQRVGGTANAMLNVIHQRLYDPDFNVNALLAACSRRNTVAFRQMLKRTPGVYIRQARMETAAWLLAETELPIWQVGDLVAYPLQNVFSDAFLRQYGVRPQAYREQLRQVAETYGLDRGRLATALPAT